MVLDKESEPNPGDAGDEEGEVSVGAEKEAPEAASKRMLHPTEKHAAQMARKGHRFFRACLSKTTAGAGTWLVQAEVELAGGYPKTAPVWTLTLKQTGTSRRSKGAPRTKRRAVSAAIDRVSDVFLAVDANTGKIVDANPAAGALLGVARDALLGVDMLSFVPELQHPTWWIELDAITEGAEPRRFEASLRDLHGKDVSIDCSITRFATRAKTLALLLARLR